MPACRELFSAPTKASDIGRDAYDLTRKQKADEPRNAAEAENGALEQWVRSVRVTVGGDDVVSGWNMCVRRSHMVYEFKNSGDWYFDYTPDLAGVLAGGVRILLYGVS